MSCGCGCSIEAVSLVYFPGDTIPLRLLVAYAEIGAAYNLTGCTLTLSVKASDGDPDSAALWRKTSPSGGISIVDAAAGLAIVSPTLAESRTLVAGRTYHLDVIVRDASGHIVTAGMGYLNALGRATITPA